MPEARQFDLSKGRLNERPLAAVLWAARHLGATGVVRFDAAQGTSRMYLKSGAPVGAQASQGARPLAQILVQHGLVDVETIDRALPELEQGRSLPDVLKQMGAIDEHGLAEAASLQHKEHLHALSRLLDGAWEFTSEALPAWTETVQLEPDAVFAEALGAPEAEVFVIDLLVELGPRWLKLSDTAPRVFSLLGATEKEKAALLAFAEHGSWEDLVARGIEEPRARLLAAALFALGGAQPVDPKEDALEGARQAAAQIVQRAQELARERSLKAAGEAKRPAGPSKVGGGDLMQRLAASKKKAEAKQLEKKAAEEARQAAQERAEALLKDVRAAREKAVAEAQQAARELLAEAENDAKKIEEAARERALQASQDAEEEAKKSEALAAELAQQEQLLAQAEAELESAKVALSEEEERLRQAEEEYKRIESEGRAEVEILRGRASDEARARLAAGGEGAGDEEDARARADAARARIAELEPRLQQERERLRQLAEDKRRLEQERIALEVQTEQALAHRDAARAEIDAAKKKLQSEAEQAEAREAAGREAAAQQQRADQLEKELALQQAAREEAERERDEEQRRLDEAGRVARAAAEQTRVDDLRRTESAKAPEPGFEVSFTPAFGISVPKEPLAPKSEPTPAAATALPKPVEAAAAEEAKLAPEPEPGIEVTFTPALGIPRPQSLVPPFEAPKPDSKPEPEASFDVTFTSPFGLPKPQPPAPVIEAPKPEVEPEASVDVTFTSPFGLPKPQPPAPVIEAPNPELAADAEVTFEAPAAEPVAEPPRRLEFRATEPAELGLAGAIEAAAENASRAPAPRELADADAELIEVKTAAPVELSEADADLVVATAAPPPAATPADRAVVESAAPGSGPDEDARLWAAREAAEARRRARHLEAQRRAEALSQQLPPPSTTAPVAPGASAPIAPAPIQLDTPVPIPLDTPVPIPLDTPVPAPLPVAGPLEPPAPVAMELTPDEMAAAISPSTTASMWSPPPEPPPSRAVSPAPEAASQSSWSPSWAEAIPAPQPEPEPEPAPAPGDAFAQAAAGFEPPPIRLVAPAAPPEANTGLRTGLVLADRISASSELDMPDLGGLGDLVRGDMVGNTPLPFRVPKPAVTPPPAAWLAAPTGSAAAAPPAPKPPEPPAVTPLVGLGDLGDEDTWNAAMARPAVRPEANAAEAGEDSLSNPDDARARRQRLLRRAFGNLGTFPSPAAPQGTVPVASETPTPTPTPASSPIPAASRPPAPPSPPKAWASSTSTTDDTALARTIEAKAAQLKGDHFAVLGIPRTATHDQVKAAYLQLVKTFHPDHLPSSLSHLSQQVKDIFTGVREAYDTLLDDARREVYLKQITRPAEPAPATKNESAVDALEKQAELHLRKKEYARAAEVFAKAFALSDSAGLLAQQAWCIYLDPARKADLPKVKQMLDQALLKDPLCDKAAYALGVLARVEGDLAKAEKHFKTALAGNPRHAEAATELRLIERRRKKT